MNKSQAQKLLIQTSFSDETKKFYVDQLSKFSMVLIEEEGLSLEDKIFASSEVANSVKYKFVKTAKEESWYPNWTLHGNKAYCLITMSKYKTNFYINASGMDDFSMNKKYSEKSEAEKDYQNIADGFSIELLKELKFTND